ncbi:hypothetical protein RJG79_00760 [Mycoplasmatota bacterium WC44]
MKKIDLFHFGSAGMYDKLNPFYIYDKEYASEVLFLIASNNPFTLDNVYISDKLKSNIGYINDLLSSMVEIQMIREDHGKYCINFPIFLEKDIEILSEFAKKTAKKIADILIDHKSNIIKMLPKMDFSNERLMYHIIGDYILDGTSLKYFSDKKVFKISKQQIGNRDYLLIGFENSDLMNSFSNNILCSKNNYVVDNIKFNSFGDGNGERHDVYRLIRNKVCTRDYVDCSVDFINRIIKQETYLEDLTPIEKDYYKFFEKLGYLHNSNSKIYIKVPIFTKEHKKTLTKISNYILDLIELDVISSFKDIKQKSKTLSALKHDVCLEEIANELWHQLFGGINEHLVKEGFFAKPKHILNQGRYFQSLYIS